MQLKYKQYFFSVALVLLDRLVAATAHIFFLRGKMRHACSPPWGADGRVSRSPTD